MDDLVKEVDKVLTQFLREEIGNKVTQFNMKGLRGVLVQTIISYKPKEKTEVKKEDAKK